MTITAAPAGIKAYRLSVQEIGGPTLLIERDANQFRDALLGFWEECCHRGLDREPDIDDTLTLEIEPVIVTAEQWRDASEFEWEGFWS